MPHRYFTRELADGRAALTGSDAHHLADVMRARIGEEVVLCGPDGLEYLGTVTAIEPGRVEFSVTDGTTSKAEPNCAVTLFAGYPKAGKLEEVIGTGTAAVVSPVKELDWEGKVAHISGGHIGELTQKLYDTLTGIQWGKLPDTKGWIVPVE